MNYKSSIGINSSDFQLDMFDVEGLFGGSVDRGRISMDRLALIEYESGRYAFRMTPDGVRISTESDQILPIGLREGALSVVQQIDEIRAESKVEIDEFDFQCAFEIERTNATELSSQLSNSSLVNQIIQASLSEVRIRILYEESPFRYSLSIQPSDPKEGAESRNLSILMYGMLDVPKESSIARIFSHHATFINHVMSIRERIDRALD